MRMSRGMTKMMLMGKYNPDTRKHTLCKPAQSKRTWTFHKSHCAWKFTRKMTDQARDTRFVQACAVETCMDLSQEPFCLKPCWKNAGPQARKRTFCTSLRSQNAHGHLKRSICVEIYTVQKKTAFTVRICGATQFREKCEPTPVKRPATRPAVAYPWVIPLAAPNAPAVLRNKLCRTITPVIPFSPAASPTYLQRSNSTVGPVQALKPPPQHRPSITANGGYWKTGEVHTVP